MIFKDTKNGPFALPHLTAGCTSSFTDIVKTAVASWEAAKKQASASADGLSVATKRKLETQLHEMHVERATKVRGAAAKALAAKRLTRTTSLPAEP